eukprot:7501098-Alexandrium_andersonii.AAC.1
MAAGSAPAPHAAQALGGEMARQPPSPIIRPEPAGLSRRAADQRRTAIGRRVQREAEARQGSAAEDRHHATLEHMEAGADARPPPAGAVRLTVAN